MKVSKNTAINFGKNQNILINLAQAAREAHCIALRELPHHERETVTKLELLRSHLDKALEDRSFSRFISNFKVQLLKLIPLKLNKKRTLPEIINYTEHFGEEISETIKTNGFKVFKRELIATVKRKFPTDKNQVSEKIHKLIEALQPITDK